MTAWALHRTSGRLPFSPLRPGETEGRSIMSDAVYQRCLTPACGQTRDLTDTTFRCPACGGLLDVAYDWNRLDPLRSLRDFEAKWSRRTDPLAFSGVWRFRELLPFAPPEKVVTVG